MWRGGRICREGRGMGSVWCGARPLAHHLAIGCHGGSAVGRWCPPAQRAGGERGGARRGGARGRARRAEGAEGRGAREGLGGRRTLLASWVQNAPLHARVGTFCGVWWAATIPPPLWAADGTIPYPGKSWKPPIFFLSLFPSTVVQDLKPLVPSFSG